MNNRAPIGQCHCRVAAGGHAGDASSLAACVKQLNPSPNLLNQTT